MKYFNLKYRTARLGCIDTGHALAYKSGGTRKKENKICSNENCLGFKKRGCRTLLLSTANLMFDAYKSLLDAKEQKYCVRQLDAQRAT